MSNSSLKWQQEKPYRAIVNGMQPLEQSQGLGACKTRITHGMPFNFNVINFYHGPSFFFGGAMGIFFFSSNFLFWKKIPSVENFGDFENMFNLFI
jgi:hypothetical protein